ncbi:hypothetical protein HDU92_008895 [Lobulomyces angularis]|nr:hypothetical protein HDU92_008895 [Lobulomyces angularis]
MSLNVSLGGILFAALYCDVFTLDGDVEGLLLGTTKSKTVTQITDNEDLDTTEIKILITSYKIIGRSINKVKQRFYDREGSIDVEFLKSKLKESNYSLEDVVGYFKFRRNSLQAPFLREKLIYSSLRKEIMASNEKPNSKMPFVLGIFTQDSLHDGATLNFDYNFFNQENDVFVNITSNIKNLGESSTLKHSQFVAISPKLNSIYLDSQQFKYNNLLVKETELMLTNYLSRIKDLSVRLKESEHKVAQLRNKPATTVPENK